MPKVYFGVVLPCVEEARQRVSFFSWIVGEIRGRVGHMEYPFDFFIVILSCVDYDASIAWPWTALGGKYVAGTLPTRCPSTHACPPCLSSTLYRDFPFQLCYL